jgi:hypothetical protein
MVWDRAITVARISTSKQRKHKPDWASRTFRNSGMDAFCDVSNATFLLWTAPPPAPGKDRFGNSKHGDRYLRSLFTAGALAVIRYAKIHGTSIGPKTQAGARLCSSDARTSHTDQGPSRSVEFHRGS